MSSIWRVVTERNHALNLLIRKAAPADPIFIQLVKKKFLPKVHLNIMEELLFLIGGEIMGEKP